MHRLLKQLYIFALSQDGRYALTGSDDWHASLWDINIGNHL